MMDARPMELPFDAAGLKGLSERLLRSHHQNNYGGAVKRLNAIRKQWRDLPVSTAPGFQLNGLKREELMAHNSMLLHELYFGSLGGNGADMAPAMALALQANFGSVQRWREEFIAMARKHSDLVPVTVEKMRYGFTVEGVICEYAQVWFNGAMVESACCESENYAGMRQVVESLGIAAMPNTNYLKAAKRVVGME